MISGWRNVADWKLNSMHFLTERIPYDEQAATEERRHLRENSLDRCGICSTVLIDGSLR